MSTSVSSQIGAIVSFTVPAIFVSHFANKCKNDENQIKLKAADGIRTHELLITNQPL
jgi:hypothetical protein